MQSTIDHITIYCPKDQFVSVVKWYMTALAPLKFKEIMTVPGGVGLGSETPDFWIGVKENFIPAELHFAFVARDHETVDAFHKAALEAGGTCNGAPGLRPQYHPNYYGAFVIDPLGNNVEVVDHLAH